RLLLAVRVVHGQRGGAHLRARRRGPRNSDGGKDDRRKRYDDGGRRQADSAKHRSSRVVGREQRNGCLGSGAPLIRSPDHGLAQTVRIMRTASGGAELGPLYCAVAVTVQPVAVPAVGKGLLSYTVKYVVFSSGSSYPPPVARSPG